MVQIRANTREIEIRLNELQEAIEDFSPLWDILIERVIVRHIKRTFDTAGHGSWPQRQDNLSHPLLQLSGDLLNSLINPNSSNNINEQSKDQLTYGSDLFYSVYHEEGTSNIPERSFLRTTLEQSQFERDIINEIEKYFQNIIDRR